MSRASADLVTSSVHTPLPATMCTWAFVSKFCNCLEATRRDDIESLIYVLIYSIFKKLPWLDVRGASKNEKLKIITKMKADPLKSFARHQMLIPGKHTQLYHCSCLIKHFKFAQRHEVRR